MTATTLIEPKMKKGKTGIDVDAFNAARREELLEATDSLGQVLIACLEGEQDDPPEEHYGTLVEAVRVFGYLPLPGDFAPYVRDMESLAQGVAGVVGYEDLRGRRPQLAELERLSEVRRDFEKKTEPRPRLETLEELKEQGVSIRQVALMHGLTEADVRREWDAPGTVCGPDYVPPIFLKQASGESQQWCAGMHLSQLALIVRTLWATYHQR